jgi:hypothetical protein
MRDPIPDRNDRVRSENITDGGNLSTYGINKSSQHDQFKEKTMPKLDEK